MLLLICGLPRAGKTTFSMQFDNVIHSDGIGYKKVVELISNTTDDVVVDGVYNRARERTKITSAYKGKYKKCVWLNTPDEIRRKRPMWHPCHDVYFEPPTEAEGWDEIVILVDK